MDNPYFYLYLLKEIKEVSVIVSQVFNKYLAFSSSSPTSRTLRAYPQQLRSVISKAQ